MNSRTKNNLKLLRYRAICIIKTAKKYTKTALEELDYFIEEWQDENRTYTPAERNLAVRLDRRFVPV